MFHPLPTFIAGRYLRSKRKNRFASFISVASVLGIALGVAVLVIVLSVMNGFEVEVTRHILGMTSHASILEAGGRNLGPWRDVAAEVKRDPRVSGAAPFIRASGMLNHRGHNRGVVIYGIPPAAEHEVSDLPKHLEGATLAALSADPPTILLGQALAHDLDAKAGDSVTLVVPRWDPEQGLGLPVYQRVTVAGIFHSGMYEYDSTFAMLHIDAAAKLFEFGDTVTGLRVNFSDPPAAPRYIQDIINRLGPPFVALNWTQYHRNFFYALKSQKRMMFVILSLIVAVAAFNIVASMIMVVKEKGRDIAILRTIGLAPRAVLAIFLSQGVLIGLGGVALGVLLGMLGTSRANAFVHGAEQVFGVQFIKPDVYYIDYLPVDLRLGDVVAVGFAAFVICVAATLYPAWRASRIAPAEALRYE
ncbi:MAG: lipoprotein-releasing ABC transporter permease subunit [Gammaproteobacteria bacterium]|nr:lipoprotein-releasing ABC transporter permease subunit [Gammaproteobacteria bacterium]